MSESPRRPPSPSARWPLSFRLNERDAQCTAAAGAMLSDVLREGFGLTGTKVACDQAACGACTVHVDGLAVFACHTAALQVDGARVRTIEGLADGERLHPLQQAFMAHNALQCGFCTPGMLMALHAALAAMHAKGIEPTRDRLAQAISGNLCRCGAYPAILAAAMAVANGGAPATAPATAPTAATPAAATTDRSTQAP